MSTLPEWRIRVDLTPEAMTGIWEIQTVLMDIAHRLSGEGVVLMWSTRGPDLTVETSDRPGELLEFAETLLRWEWIGDGLTLERVRRAGEGEAEA